MPNRPGLIPYSKNALTPKDVFSLFMTDEIMQSILGYTNMTAK